MNRRRRQAVLVAAVAAMATMGLAVPAFACTNLASINLSSTFGEPGERLPPRRPCRR
ncbi:MAG: hypothetical protein ACRD2W_24820 [Acidimicrobiales bacterium]